MHLHEHEPGSSPQPSAPKAEHETVADALEPLRAGRGEAATPQGIAHLQRAAGNGSVSELLNPDEAVMDVVGRDGGQPLDPGVQRDMESRIGADFSDVRVHTDSRAGESAQALRANAYTVGGDIVFGQGQYDPASRAGQRTLAHELTHVVQQRQGPVDGAAIGSGAVKVSDPGDRFEQAAEHNADRVMAADPPAAQRQEEDEELQMAAQRQEEELQMTAQREDLGAEEEELQA